LRNRTGTGPQKPLPGLSRYDDAARYYEQALAIARDIGEPYEQGRAHTAMAHALHTLGQPDEAQQHYREALEIYQRLRAPEADAVNQQLTTWYTQASGSRTG
jgi:tetratricopeptide (TPR) repeat protein